MLSPDCDNYGKSARIGVESCSGLVSHSVLAAGWSYLSKMQKGERQAKRTTWFRGQNVPILYSTGRKDILGSEDWIARGTIQRIGTIIIATVFFCGSAALVVASPLLRDEISEMIGGVLGLIVGTGLAAFAILVACIGMFLTFRLVRGVVRAFNK